jgi:predicted amidohydrolase
MSHADMPSTVRLAVCQVDIRPLEPDRNRERLVDTARAAAREHQAEIVLLPELANIGYVRHRDRQFGEQYLGLAEPLDGPTVTALGELAAEHGVVVVVGIAERHRTIPSTIFNSAIVLGRRGIIGVHRKVHLPGEEKHYFAAGDRAEVFETEFGVVGVSICYDTFFPELARIYALSGAHMILCPFNTAERFDHPDTLPHFAAARAIENKLFVATCNRVGSEGDLRFNGRSAVADPYGHSLLQLGEEEETAVAVLEASQLARERAYHPIFIDRRPELYGALAKRLDQ